MRYEFKCKNCGEKKEVSLKVSERDNIQKCDDCQGEMVRVLSCPGVSYVGSGWADKKR